MQKFSYVLKRKTWAALMREHIQGRGKRGTEMGPIGHRQGSKKSRTHAPNSSLPITVSPMVIIRLVLKSVHLFFK